MGKPFQLPIEIQLHSCVERFQTLRAELCEMDIERVGGGEEVGKEEQEMEKGGEFGERKERYMKYK